MDNLEIRHALPQDAVAAGLAQYRAMGHLLGENTWQQDQDQIRQGLIDAWGELITEGSRENRIAVATLGGRIVAVSAVRYLRQLGHDLNAVRPLELTGIWVDPLALEELGIKNLGKASSSFVPLWQRSAVSEAKTKDANGVTRISQRLLDYVLPGLGAAQTWVYETDGQMRDFLRANGFTLDGMERTCPQTSITQQRLVR
ncbi:hypothetical protein KRX54_07200 [Actinomycetaceae bacterium TAE3-ERU4]|nr:hypothetical protein [Actinomycetaceae bacterium TAE3-ERU4]